MPSERRGGDQPGFNGDDGQTQGGSRSGMGGSEMTSDDRRQLDQQQGANNTQSGQTPDPSEQPEQEGSTRRQREQGTAENPPVQGSSRSRSGAEAGPSDQPEQEGSAGRRQ
jgi:hypothetical protein